MSKVDSLDANVDSLNGKVDSLDANIDSSVDKSNRTYREYSLSEKAESLLKKKRLSKADMEQLIGEIASEWRTIQELTEILDRDKTYLRNHILPSLISKGALEREYPSIPNHPNQRYRLKQS